MRTDKITLDIRDHVGPGLVRRVTLTGGTFREMVAAVKRQGGRYQSYNRTWSVTADQAKALMAQFADGRARQVAEAEKATQERAAKRRAEAKARAAEPATARQIAYIKALMAERGYDHWEPPTGLTKAAASAKIEGILQGGIPDARPVYNPGEVY